MIILYAKTSTKSYEAGDIIAFHSTLKAVGGEDITPNKSVFQYTYNHFGLNKKDCGVAVLPDNQEVMNRFWDYIYNEKSGKIEQKMRPYLILKTTAKDTVSPYDGYPDIPADGESKALIKIQKMYPGDNPAVETSDSDEIHIKTSRGKLSDLKLQLKKGRGQFYLTSVPESVVATVEAYDPRSKIKRGRIQIQFA